ncbi:hypothetical protein [Actinacidiphila yeochonensis]|uniref:hypothetical protein n=1 Tax=Actinacidiphila yeochonensis TaxID=89050 RepID=UPI000AFDA209|nr:hypothetical protein [Actinacidiphila yeochonensis]
MANSGDLRREITSDLVDECLDRSGGKVGRDVPLVVFSGPRGSGKTRLLEDVRDRFTDSVAAPYAWLDLAGKPYTRAWQVAAHLAGSLGATRWKRFGSMGFPRLTLGALVIQQDAIGLNDPSRARADVEQLLRGQRSLDGAQQVVTDLLRQLLTFVLPPLASVADPLVSAAFTSRRAVRLLFQTGTDWYGNRGHGQPGDGFGALADLSTLEHRQGDAGHDEVDRLLCQAFLADIAAAYGSQRDPRNTLALIDNVDESAGTAFLEALAGARHTAKAASGSCDPLVVFSTSGRRLDALWSWRPEGDADATGRHRLIGDAGSAGYRDWERRRPPTGTDHWYYAVALDDFDEDRVRTMASRARPRELSRLTSFVHRSTFGHPGGTARVLEYLATRPSTPGEAELTAVLDARVSGSGTLGDELLERLLSDELAPWRSELVTWSAVRDPKSALGARIGLRPGQPARRDIADAVSQWLWQVPSGSPFSTEPELHPLLRRLLLRSLAARPDSHPLNWAAVHRRFEEWFLGRGEGERACYHALANGNLRPAVDHLVSRFRTDGAERWIRAFDDITSAPNRLALRPAVRDRDGEPERSAPTAYLHLDALLESAALADPAPVAGPADPDAAPDPLRTVLTHLVAARWIRSDPLLDPHQKLNVQLADGFTELHRLATRDSTRYSQEGEYYRHLRDY